MGDDASSGMVGELWTRIVAWLDENAPRSADALVRTGASETDLARAETSTGLEWTDELRTWFTVQGGAGHLGTLRLHGLLEPLSLQESLAVRDTYLAIWRRLVEDDPDLREEPGRAGSGGLAFRGEFIPVADDPGGSVLVVDLRPGARRGCVGTLVDEAGVSFRELGWPSIAAWLEDVVAALSEGSLSLHGSATVEDGRLLWRVPEPAYNEIDIVYDGSYEVPGERDHWWDGDAEQRTAGLRARAASWPDEPPPGWPGPWPPLPAEMQGGVAFPDGQDGVLVASVGFDWSTGFGGGRPAPATTRLHLTYRREDDPRAPQQDATPGGTVPTALAAGPFAVPRVSLRRRVGPSPLPDIWAELVAWLAEHAPATAQKVAASATDPDEVAAAEAAAQMTVPWSEELRWWFTVAPSLANSASGQGLLGDYYTLSAASAVEDIVMWREIERDEERYDADGLAGEDVGSFIPEFVPIATDGAGGTLVVDLRPGPESGCVRFYTAEEGTMTGDGGRSWPGINALVHEVLCALVEGDEFEGSTSAVTDDGEVEWLWDEGPEPESPIGWSWAQVRHRVAAAWQTRDDTAVWAALVDALLEFRALSPHSATQATWEEPLPIGDPVIDALIAGAARHAQDVLGRDGSTWGWRRELDDHVPVEAGVDAAEEMRLHDATPSGFLSVGLLLDPSRLPY